MKTSHRFLAGFIIVATLVVLVSQPKRNRPITRNAAALEPGVVRNDKAAKPALRANELVRAETKAVRSRMAPSPAGQPVTSPAIISPVKPAAAVVSGASAISGFASWAEGFMETKPRGTIGDGTRLARERKSAMAELIQKDPERALAATIPYRIRKALPPEITQYLEERISGTGDLLVSIATDFVKQQSTISHSVELEGKRYKAFVYGRRAGSQTRHKIPLHGIVLDDFLAVDENPIRILEAEETADLPQDQICSTSGKLAKGPNAVYADVGGRIKGYCSTLHARKEARTALASDGDASIGGGGSGPIASAWTTGNKTFLFLRIRYSDNLTEPVSEPDAQAIVATVSQWFSTHSYGQLSFAPTVSPLVTVPHPRSYYTYWEDLVRDALAAAEAQGLNPYSYDMHVVRAPATGDWPFGGVAWVGGMSCLVVVDGAYIPIHELGHNLGLYHANKWRAAVESPIGNGISVEYGDVFDVMGSGQWVGLPSYNGYFKTILNWIPASHVTTVTASDTYILYPFDTDSLTAGRAYELKIQRDAITEYWAELRHVFSDIPGVYFHWSAAQRSNFGSALLHMTPEIDYSLNAPLALYRTFSDYAADIHITPISQSGTGPDRAVSVVVNVGPFPGNQRPTVTLARTGGTPINPFESVTFTATVTDDDSSLMYHWDFGDVTPVVGINLSQVTKTWGSAGEHVVRCQVSDMKGGVGSANMLVRVGSPGTLRASGKVLATGGAPVEGARIFIPGTSVSTYSDSQGQYYLVGLAAGEIDVRATNVSYLVSPSGANPINLAGTRDDLDFTAAPLPKVNIVASIPTASDDCHEPGKFTITRTGPTTSPLVVHYRIGGTALAGFDYSLEGLGIGNTVTIPIGAASKDIRVIPANVRLIDGPVTVAMVLDEDFAYTLVPKVDAIVTLTQPWPIVSIGYSGPVNVCDVTVATPVSFTVSRSGSTVAALPVTLTAAGSSAVRGTDFVILNNGSVISEEPFNITIPAGSPSATLQIQAFRNSSATADRFVAVNLACGAGYSRSRAAGAAFNMPGPAPSLSIGGGVTGSVCEGSPDLPVTLSCSGIDEQVSVRLRASGTDGATYQLIVDGAVVTQNPFYVVLREATPVKTMYVRPLDNPEQTGPSTLTLSIECDVGYRNDRNSAVQITLQDAQSAVAAILDPVERDSSGTAVLRETTGSPLTVTLTRAGSCLMETTIPVTLEGNAIYGTQYRAKVNGAFVTPPFAVPIDEDATTATFELWSFNDSQRTGDKFITISAGLGLPAKVVRFDYETPEISLSIGTLIVREGDTQTKWVDVKRRGSQAGPVTVNLFATSQSAIFGTDFQIYNGSVLVPFPAFQITVPAGLDFAHVIVNGVADSLIEGVETAAITLGADPNSYRLGELTECELKIKDPVPYTGLVAAWHGEGNALDAVGNNDGVLRNGAGFTTGIRGQAFLLDGVNDFIHVPHNESLLIANEITIELWFKRMNSSSGVLIDKRNWTRDQFGALIASDFGLELYYQDPNTGGGAYQVSYSTVPSVGRWHHFIGTFKQLDSSHVELKTYVDGLLVRTDTRAGNLANAFNSDPLSIGVDRDGPSDGTYFHGAIDEVALYNRVLSAEEALAHYTEVSGLVALWRGENDVQDTIGNNHGTFNGGFINGVNGGTAFGLDGVDDYVRILDSPSLHFPNELTVEMWFKRASILSFGGLIDKRSWTSCNYGVFLSDNLYLYFNDPAINGDAFEVIASPVPSAGVFHHFVGTFRQLNGGVEMRSYLDGELVGGDIVAGTLANTFNADPLAIGTPRDGLGGSFFEGAIDEVGLYNRVLTAQEVTDHYNSTTIPAVEEGDVVWDWGIGENPEYDENGNYTTLTYYLWWTLIGDHPYTAIEIGRKQMNDSDYVTVATLPGDATHWENYGVDAYDYPNYRIRVISDRGAGPWRYP